VFTLPEQKLQEILSQGGANGGLHVSALDRGNTNVLDEGTLAVVDNEIDQTTGTVKLKATFLTISCNFGRENLLTRV
jgi:hypothetical protein